VSSLFVFNKNQPSIVQSPDDKLNAAELGVVKFPLLKKLLYVVGVMYAGTNGEKAWTDGETLVVNAKLLALSDGACLVIIIYQK
jgi:hypothetical protein